MKLADDERAMLDGAEGPAVAAAMDLLVRYGEALDAEKLVNTRNVAGTMTQPSPGKAKLVAEGGWAKAYSVINLDSDIVVDVPRMRVPTCQLQHGFDSEALDISPYPAEMVEMQRDAETFYGPRGVNILATCTPYQVGNLPVFGEICAWMESSAVVYCNSVLGARTNCEGSASTGAAALTGKIPYFGNLLPENRYGTHLIEATVHVDSFMDWGMLGYFAGDLVQEQRPVLSGALGQPSMVDLKHCGAAMASSGGVEMFHVPGLTPEAPTIAAAFADGRIPERVAFGEAERRAAYEDLNSQGTSTDVDFILLGCPHASVDQISRVASAIEGRTMSASTQLWIMAPPALKKIADQSGYTAIIERAGGRILTGSCPAMSKAAPHGTKVFATDSAKQVHYLPAILGIEGWFGTTEDCVDAAVTGIWRGELR